MKSIRVKKGYQPKLKGAPDLTVMRLKRPDRVAVLPERIPYAKPRLKVAEGDTVTHGSLLFEDKKRPELRFLSPGGGVVEKIVFGPRRVVKAIIIRLDSDEKREVFETLSDAELKTIDRKVLIERLIQGGVWPLLRSLPYRNIADPEETPHALYINLSSKQPFSPEPEAYLQDYLEAFRFGIRVLKKLVPNLVVYTCFDNKFVLNECQGAVNHIIFGSYPANDPGVVQYHVKKGPEANNAWYINGHDVLLIAHLLETGTYPSERTYAVGGSQVKRPAHVRTRLGAPVAHLLKECGVEEGSNRFVTGGLLTGFDTGHDSFLGMYEASLSVVPEGDDKEMFGFMRLGTKKPSFSRTFLSAVSDAPLESDCNTHGEVRACVNCGYCTSVCPVDILPQFTMKALHADEIEEALEHGLLDCVECGLCTYVCPSKIELSTIFQTAKQNLHIEQQKAE